MLYTIKTPDGHLIHTVISTDPKEAIEEFVETERTCNEIANWARLSKGRPQVCASSWELFEAEGYSVVSVEIVEKQSNQL